MTQEEINHLFKDLIAGSNEIEWIEFKVNNSSPQDIGEYISALSNSACYHQQRYGYLIFGVEDVTKNLVGTSFFPKKERVGNQELENWLATQLNPRVDFIILEFDIDGRHFVVFRIDATRGTPVSFRGNPFIRIGTYKKRLDDHPERERKIWNSSTIRLFEKELALEQATEEDVLQLIDYSAFFDLIKLPLPDNRRGILEKLEQERIVVNEQGTLSITNLGALLFAKQIEKFERLGRKAVRVVIYEGINRINPKKEQAGSRGYAIGFEGLVRYILDQLPSREMIDGALRKVVSVYPPLAVRELIANAIIHQDFDISGTSPMVEIFNNRIEITNAGKPLIDPLRFVDHSPESRNEMLARFMRRLNICEERGSGIDKVVFECELSQLPAPDFVVGDRYTRAILYAPKPLRQMDKQEKVRACYLHACLKYVSGELMTNQSLRKRFGVEEHNYSTISRIIADAKEASVIKDYDPKNKSKTYSKYQPFWA